MKKLLPKLLSINPRALWLVFAFPAMLLFTACNNANQESDEVTRTAATNDAITINVPRIDMDQARGTLTNAADNIKEAAGAAVAEAERLGDRIRNELRSDRAISANADNVTIQVNDDLVTVSGSVKTGREKQLISEKVKSLAGERRVENRIKVTGE